MEKKKRTRRKGPRYKLSGSNASRREIEKSGGLWNIIWTKTWQQAYSVISLVHCGIDRIRTSSQGRAVWFLEGDGPTWSVEDNSTLNRHVQPEDCVPYNRQRLHLFYLRKVIWSKNNFKWNVCQIFPIKICFFMNRSTFETTFII